jgi:hypothetical protein
MPQAFTNADYASNSEEKGIRTPAVLIVDQPRRFSQVESQQPYINGGGARRAGSTRAILLVLKIPAGRPAQEILHNALLASAIADFNRCWKTTS